MGPEIALGRVIGLNYLQTMIGVLSSLFRHNFCSDFRHLANFDFLLSSEYIEIFNSFWSSWVRSLLIMSTRTAVRPPRLA